MLILGIKLAKVWKQASVGGVTVVVFITASGPKDGSESSCTSEANPSGFLGLADLPILLYSFSNCTGNS